MATEGDDEFDVTLRLLSAKSKAPRAATSVMTPPMTVDVVKGGRGEDSAALRRALVDHERAASADAAVAADPDRYAEFLSDALSTVLAAYGEACRTAAKAKVE